MKIKPKIKNTSKRKTKKLSSRLRLVDHRHTGRLIHRNHTSYLALVIILLIVGLFLYASESISRSEAITDNGTTSIGALVLGSAPTVGATIVKPKNGVNVVDQNTIEVSGTCEQGTFVVIKDNNILAGSTICTNASIFILQIQLQLGKNVLSALNYDNLNQPGPSTPSVTIYSIKTSAPVEEPLPIIPAPILPNNPSIIPGVDSGLSDCDDYKVGDLPIGGELNIAIVCIPRLFGTKTQQVLGFIVWGGTPPYAVSVDWGDGSETALLSIPAQGYWTETFSYSVAGVYNIAFRLTDKDGKTSIVQTALQVSGEVKTPFASFTDDISSGSWFKTPVPLYLMAVAITLGFWGGDLFDRRFGTGKHRQRYQRSA